MGREPTSQTAPLLGEGKQETKLIVKVSDTNTLPEYGGRHRTRPPLQKLVKPKKSSKGCVRLLLTLVCLMLQKLSCYRPLGNWMCKTEVWEMHRLKRTCGNNADIVKIRGPVLSPVLLSRASCTFMVQNHAALEVKHLLKPYLWEDNGLWAIASTAFMLNLQD